LQNLTAMFVHSDIPSAAQAAAFFQPLPVRLKPHSLKKRNPVISHAISFRFTPSNSHFSQRRREVGTHNFLYSSI